MTKSIYWDTTTLDEALNIEASSNRIKLDTLPLSKSLKGIHAGKRNPAYGYKWSKEQKENVSNRRKALRTFAGKNNPMYGKPSKGMLDMKHTEETKKRMSESAKKRGSNRTGKKFTPEQRKNISEGIAKLEPLKCPHCGLVSKNRSNMSRYHFDNCKNI